MVQSPGNLGWQFSERQTEALEALGDPNISEVCYGGAKGGGKSWLLCRWAYARTLQLIDYWDIQPSAYPVPVGWLGRKQAVNFRTTTLETWKRSIPPDAYTIREQHREIIIEDRAKITFGGLDNRDDVQKFQSAEFAFLGVDQAEETTQDEVAALRGSLRLTLKGKAPVFKAFWTANPAQCWLRDEFIIHPRDGFAFVQALPSDNPWLPDGYIDKLKTAFGHRPELLAAYLEGSWEAFEGPSQVILERWIRAAANRVLYPDESVRMTICDPARTGVDETVIYDMTDTRVEDAEIFGQSDDLMRVAQRCFVHYQQHRSAFVVVDVIGIGAGVVDKLREMRVPVLAVNSSAKSAEPGRYYNLRAEMWWEAGRMFSAGEVAMGSPPDVQDADATTLDSELITQLTAPCYSFRNGRVLVESKDDLRNPKRLGRSPDRGDTFVMGLAGYRFAQAGNRHASTEGMRLYLPEDRKEPPPPGSFEWRRQRAKRKRRKAAARW